MLGLAPNISSIKISKCILQSESSKDVSFFKNPNNPRTNKFFGAKFLQSVDAE